MATAVFEAQFEGRTHQPPVPGFVFSSSESFGEKTHQLVTRRSWGKDTLLRLPTRWSVEGLKGTKRELAIVYDLW